ncbi:MAG: C4-type zinc ribbon domain-containing protein [bacterium]
MIDRLSTLFHLQLIDDQLDELEELRGDLPIAVNELNSQIDSIKSQLEAKDKEKKESLEKRKTNDEDVERLQKSLKKFKAQLYQVRNNKEYDALTKEIDSSEEQINKLENESLALEDLIEQLKKEIEEITPQLDTLKKDLKEKEEELKKIIKANEKEEIRLKDKRAQIEHKVKKADYATYMRVRKAKGGVAISTVTRGACSGCHNVVPPNRQIEIRQMKRLYTCESCGRLLVSADVSDSVKTEFK